MTVKLLFFAFLMTAVVCGFFVAENSGRKDLRIYSCGMHPQVTQDGPGDCPLCNMKLTPVRAGKVAATREVPGDATVAVDSLMAQRIGIRLAPVARGALVRNVRAYGAIDYDETRIWEVTMLFRGRIEKPFVDAVGQVVKRGEPLFEIFSPELFTAQTEYLMASAASQSQVASGTNGAQKATNMIGMPGGTAKARAAARLKAFDLSDDQIAKMERGAHDAHKGLPVLSPSDGIVIEKSIVRGQTVESGMRLLGIADLSVVWAIAEATEEDLPFIKLGQEADLTFSELPSRKVRARVAFINPLLNEKSRTAKVRFEIPNSDLALKPGMYASVELRAEISPNALLVPDSAILRSGRKTTVFVALENGKFEPREIALGLRGDNDFYEVLSGLKEGERVVTSGQFLLDSESQLRLALNPISPRPEVAAEPAAPLSGKTIYTCPMSEHGAVRNSHAGKCPLCNMTLVPISEATHDKMTEEKWRKEHPAVH
jgi:Cu(I)/Ag(I) efflux system membrane fusion protein